eukprot:scaffold17411_cov113-Isochrysis_galbana.AAC.3
MTVAGAARTRVGIHHVDPRRMRALWRAHRRANRTGAQQWPAATSRGCAVNARGYPSESHPVREYRSPDSLVKPAAAQRCRSIVSFPEIQAAYPSCMLRMARLKQRPQGSPCHGGMGHTRCAGFQLDANDNCNLQVRSTALEGASSHLIRTPSEPRSPLEGAYSHPVHTPFTPRSHPSPPPAAAVRTLLRRALPAVG